jgi:hypothetical protein
VTVGEREFRWELATGEKVILSLFGESADSPWLLARAYMYWSLWMRCTGPCTPQKDRLALPRREPRSPLPGSDVRVHVGEGGA